MHHNTRLIASIWRWERVAARSVSARRRSQKRALNGHFWTTNGRLAVNWELESAKFCHEAFFQGRLPLYANFWPSSMKKCNRPQIRYFFYHYIFQTFPFWIRICLMVFFLLTDPNVKIIETAFVNSFLSNHGRNFLAPRTRSSEIKKNATIFLQKIFPWFSVVYLAFYFTSTRQLI